MPVAWRGRIRARPRLCPHLGDAPDPCLVLPLMVAHVSRCRLAFTGGARAPTPATRFSALHMWALPVPWRQLGLSPITRCHH